MPCLTMGTSHVSVSLEVWILESPVQCTRYRTPQVRDQQHHHHHHHMSVASANSNTLSQTATYDLLLK